MNILLNKLTKDSDLKIDLQVCYKDINGDFTMLGVITGIITDKDEVKNYLLNTSFGAYMADDLKLIAPVKLNSVLVKFEDSTNNYNTDVSSQTTEITAIKYFVGNRFDMGIYPTENMLQCIGIEFTDNNVKKHSSGMIYNPNKPYYICGARNAWDTVKVGLFDNETEAKGSFPQNPECVRKATEIEVNEFFNIRF